MGGFCKYFREFPSKQESVAQPGTGESEYLFSLSSAPWSMAEQLPVTNTLLLSSQPSCGLDCELLFTKTLGNSFSYASWQLRNVYVPVSVRSSFFQRKYIPPLLVKEPGCLTGYKHMFYVFGSRSKNSLVVLNFQNNLFFMKSIWPDLPVKIADLCCCPSLSRTCHLTWDS